MIIVGLRRLRDRQNFPVLPTPANFRLPTDLFLVPSLLRDLKPSVTIGFFLHTPFPSSEIFRCGPRRKEILEGLLGSNLVGFQTYAYARHFISSCTRVLGLESTPRGVEYNGNLVEVRIVPVGIDVGKVERRRKTAAVMEKMQSIREMYPGKKIVVGRDKLDQVKGVAHKLASFEKFLRLYPEFQNKVGWKGVFCQDSAQVLTVSLPC
jgi:trehalose 6-phosphate synthase/phosphatase